MLRNAKLLAHDRNLTDTVIISQVLEGKSDQYEILIRRYNQSLYKSVRGILASEEDIEDVMQEAYIKGYEKLSQFRNESSFSTWLTRILINCALQHLQKNKKRLTTDLEALNDYDHLSDEQPELQTDRKPIRDNLKSAIESAISQLPVKYRSIFILREVEQKSVKETAEILNITEDNVKTRLFRARTLLKSMLTSEVKNIELFEFHESRCDRVSQKVMKKILMTCPEL